MVSGKPNENKFSCGAERVTTPTVIFASNKIATTGNDNKDAIENICPADVRPEPTNASKLNGRPNGISS